MYNWARVYSLKLIPKDNLNCASDYLYMYI